MTIWGRDADTGMAKWVYQMTPHDEWDFDGVNEMILADQGIWAARTARRSSHFDPQRPRLYALTATNGELLVAAKFDPAVNWTTGVDMNKQSPTYGRPKVVDQYSTEHNGEDHNSKGICPAALGSKDEQPAAYSPQTGLFYVPTNHVCMDYEALQGELHGRPTLCRGDARHVPASRRDQYGQLHRLGRQDRQDRVVQQGAILGLVGRARNGRKRGLRLRERSKAISRRSTPRPARSCTSSRPRRASSAT